MRIGVAVQKENSQHDRWLFRRTWYPRRDSNAQPTA